MQGPGLFLKRRRSAVGARVLVVGAVARVLLAAGDARAQGAGFALDRLEVSERGSRWFALESLELRGDRRLAAGLVAGYQHRPLVVTSPSGDTRAAVVDHVLTTHLGAAMVLAGRFRVGLSVPLVLYTGGEAGVVRGTSVAPPASAQAFGDPRIGGDVRLFGRHDEPITMAVGVQAWLPLGSVDSYASDGAFRLGPRVSLAGAAGAFVYAARVGLSLRDPERSSFAGTPVGTELAFGAAAGVKLAADRVRVGPELFGSTTVNDATFAERTTPLEALLGAHAALGGGLTAGAGVGAGLASGYGAPAARALLSIDWSPEPSVDTDGDGIDDARDACPSVSGQASADPKTHGCPPPPPRLDTDGDAIPDEDDACMDVRGVRTADPRTNGCIDRDGDGLMDPLDRCPFQAGPPSDDPAKNGCPPVVDADEDGVPDPEDACPAEPGPRSDDPEASGCPTNPDRDGDGIPNDADACPDEPGGASAEARARGCPKASVVDGRIRLLGQPVFVGDTARLAKDEPASLEVLHAIRAVLQAHPELTKVRVEAHSDNRDEPRRAKRHSAQRAAAVVEWLVEHGIDRGRLTSVGMGMERPVDTNATEEGRAANRRIELVVEALSRGEAVAPAPPVQ